MPTFTPKATKPPKIERVSNRDWLKGTVTAFDDGRTPSDGLRDSGNLILEQNGTVRPRPSLVSYGPEPTGTILGEVFEFIKENNGTREFWLATMQNVGGTTKVYIAKGEDDAWTVCNGKEYDDSADAHFVQIDNKILVMNGVDSLSYLDTSNNTITAFVELSTPGTLSGTATGLSGTSFKVYYSVTANSTVGETDGSAVLEKQVGTDRDLWDPDSQSVSLTWPALSGVQSWNVYCGVSADGAGTPKLYAIATGLDASTLSFTDNGSRAQDLSRPLPTDNGTAGPKVTRGTVSNGRVWLVGDTDHPYYVWRGGDFGFELDFSPANGGGFTPIGNGTKEVPSAIKAYRNGKGDSMLTVLSQGTNGSGRRYYLNPTTVTFGASTFIVWQVTEDSGLDGTDSPDGVIVYQNSLWYPSRDGFKTTGTKPQLQNVLSTDKITNTIQDKIPRLTSSSMHKAVGIAYDNRLYWSLPVASTSNNQIWVQDLERNGAWMIWNIAADWLTLYNDNMGKTRFLALVDNAIYELSYATKTSDNGTTVITSGVSGHVRFSEDGREWGRLIQLIFVVLRPQGSLVFTVDGYSEDGLVAYQHEEVFSGSSTRVGWSEPKAGWSNRGWSKVKSVPVTFNTAVVEVPIEIDEDLQWYQYGWYSNSSGTDYSISEVVSEYVNVGIKDLA